ncbi:hypothetical protein EDB86DRAFT_610991 [Lactarius hatsudake]|nr:hypothetical protein EDB86DRAFT_610991 [Lactarius hatsudake]
MDLGDRPTDADADVDARGVNDDVVPPLPPPPLLRTAATHNHPDGPMLGFVIPEHDGVDHGPGPGVDVGHALTSPTKARALSLLPPIAAAKDRSTGAPGTFSEARVLVQTRASASTLVMERSTSVLGGGSSLSPGKIGDDPSSPVRVFGGVQPSRATDEDDEEEEDDMGMLFENTRDDGCVPPSGLGKGKGKARAVIVDGVFESSESVATAAGSRMRRKTWRKELADEAEVGENNDSNDGISAPVFTNTRCKKRTPTSSSSGVLPVGLTFCYHCRSTIRRPKMRCTLIKASTDKPCRNLFCEGCIEKRYATPSYTVHISDSLGAQVPPADVRFDRTVDDLECPACRNYCNRSLCSRKRGDAYIPERDGGWRSWIARQGGTHALRRSPQRRARATISGRRRQR